MELSEIKARIENRPRNKEIKNAREIDAVCEFFVTSQIERSKVFDDFLLRIKEKLANKLAFQKFEKSIRFPLEVNNLCKNITEQLENVFNGENKNATANLKKIKEASNFSVDFDFYKNVFYPEYASRPNSLILIKKDEDKFLHEFILSSEIIDFEYIDNSTEIFEFVIFQKENFMYYVSASEIIKFEKFGDSIEIDGKPVSIVLPNCPIFNISNEILNNESDFVRSNMYVPYFADLDLFQELTIYKKMLMPYAFNLIVERLRNDCNYTAKDDHDNDIFCVSGYLHSRSNDGDPHPLHRRCPACNPAISPGMELYKTKDFSFEKNTSGDSSRVLTFISVPTDTMVYSDGFLDKLKTKIYNGITGKNKDNVGNQNPNEIAVLTNNHSVEIVLMNLKTKFEKTIRIIENLKGTWLAGDNFLAWELNLGDRFNVTSKNDLLKELEIVDKHFHEYRKSLKQRIITTQYISQPKTLKRQKILLDLYPDADLNNDFVLDKIKFIQANFNYLIYKYEAEQGSISNNYKPSDEIKKEISSFFEKEFATWQTERNIQIITNL